MGTIGSMGSLCRIHDSDKSISRELVRTHPSWRDRHPTNYNYSFVRSKELKQAFSNAHGHTTQLGQMSRTHAGEQHHGTNAARASTWKAVKLSKAWANWTIEVGIRFELVGLIRLKFPDCTRIT